jgi:FkbM family methyltransferase
MKSYLKAALPEGLARLLKYKQRFQKLNHPGQYAFHRKYRKALDMSHLELLPLSIQDNLKLVVDVGANIGEWSIALAQLTQAQQIIAYEPVPEAFASLLNNTRPYSQIRCVNSAVGATTGEVQMNVENLSKLSSVLQLRDELREIHGVAQLAQRQVTVPLISLDEALKEYEEITLLKVDVQGYEPQVFAGACEVLQRTKVLLTEVVYVPYYRGDTQFDALHKIITSTAPFRLYGISEPLCSPVGEPLWADAVYVKAD